MKIPFTVDQFLSVFVNYNTAIWPMQILAYLLGITAVYLLIKKTRLSDKIISGLLSFTWIWVGAVYHITYFSSINKAAYLFGALFIVQGIFFLLYGVLKPGIVYGQESKKYRFVGGAFILYAMLIYPVLGYLQGHGYPQSPVFGVAPCPVTIFTFGLLLFADNLPVRIVVIPLLWSVIGFFAALNMGIREDIGLLVAGLVGSSMIILKQRAHETASIKILATKM